MTIIDLDYLSVVAGQTFDPDSPEGKQAQHYITAVEAYVSTVTGLMFGDAVTDAVIRQQADYYGIVELENDPQAVTSVVDVNDVSQTDLLTVGLGTWFGCRGVLYDGLNTISGLYPHQVVDVTMDYGTDITVALQSFVAEAVLEILTGTDPTDVVTLTIGNKTETYQKVKTVAEKLDQAVFDYFRVTEQTWRLGPTQFPRYPNLPAL